MKIYCQNCGNATEYSLNKPKFCSSCGSGFQISASITPVSVKPTPKPVETPPVVNPKLAKRVQEIQAEQEEEESNFTIPETDSFEFEVKGLKSKKETVKDIMGTRDDGFRRNLPKPKGKWNKKSAIKQFQKEASVDRSKSIEIGGDE